MSFYLLSKNKIQMIITHLLKNTKKILLYNSFLNNNLHLSLKLILQFLKYLQVMILEILYLKYNFGSHQYELILQLFYQQPN